MRYGFRQLLRSPSFFATATILIALGIAATTQIFTLVDTLLLRPLPVRDPQSLVQVFVRQQKRPADPFFDYLFFKQLSHNSSTLSSLIGQVATTRLLEHGASGDRVYVMAVTDNFFTGLGIQPLLGSTFGAGASHVAVLSYAYWSRHFSGDRKAVGQIARLQGHPYTIAGVAPEEFSGSMVDSAPDLWIPFTNLPELSRNPKATVDDTVIEILGRLRPGVSPAQAQQETASLWTRYMASRRLATDRIEVRSIAHGVSSVRDQFQTALTLLMAGTGLLMLIVSANVGGLLLSRATAREKETAVRIALGASRVQVLRQWLIESLILTAAGGSLGVLVAFAGMPLLNRWMPPAHGVGFDPAEIRQFTLPIHLNFEVAAFACAASLVTALLCAVAPAWRSSRSDLNLMLKATISDRRNQRFQSLLCGVQIALCAMLLVSAGLVIRSLSNLRNSNAGFDRDRVTLFSIDPQVRRYDSARTWAMQQKLVDGVRSLPGVEGAALADRALMRGIGYGSPVIFAGQCGDGVINSSVNFVTPGYFEVMGIRFLAGRNFSATESSEENKLNKVVVNEAFVRKFLNGRNPLGQQFDTGRQFRKPSYEIIGVVSDTKYRSLREVPPPLYYGYEFGPHGNPDAFILHVRSRGDARAIIEPVRQLLRSIDPQLPLYQVATLSEEVDQSLWQERFLVALTSCFGVFALSLSAIGLYGILAYFVVRREREIGLHIALGATSRHVIWLVVSRVIPTLGLGIVAGAFLSWLASRALGSLLYGVEPFDPWSASAALMLLMAVGLAGAVAPALRAIRVDPASTLRQ